MAFFPRTSIIISLTGWQVLQHFNVADFVLYSLYEHDEYDHSEVWSARTRGSIQESCQYL